MKVQVKDKQGREENPHKVTKFFCDAWKDGKPDCQDKSICDCEKYRQFEAKITKHPAPSIADGTHECELKWQVIELSYGKWRDVKPMEDVDNLNSLGRTTSLNWVLAEQNKEGINLDGMEKEVDDFIETSTADTYNEAFKEIDATTRIAELEARVAELEGVLNTKQEARFIELVNYEINWAKSEISNLPKVNDGTQKAFFDGFILGCGKIKQLALKELATNALKNQQP